MRGIPHSLVHPQDSHQPELGQSLWVQGPNTRSILRCVYQATGRQLDGKRSSQDTHTGIQ